MNSIVIATTSLNALATLAVLFYVIRIQNRLSIKVNFPPQDPIKK